MLITFDPRKRQATLDERNLDFADAALVFVGDTVDAVDDRHDYGETRIVTVGRLHGRTVIVVCTERVTSYRWGRPMSASRGSVGRNSAKVDAHEDTAEAHDEVSELDEAFFVRAVRHRNGVAVDGVPVDRGPSPMTLDVDPEIVARFQAAGPGWEQRIEEVLRRAVGLWNGSRLRSAQPLHRDVLHHLRERRSCGVKRRTCVSIFDGWYDRADGRHRASSASSRSSSRRRVKGRAPVSPATSSRRSGILRRPSHPSSTLIGAPRRHAAMSSTICGKAAA